MVEEGQVVNLILSESLGLAADLAKLARVESGIAVPLLGQIVQTLILLNSE